MTRLVLVTLGFAALTACVIQDDGDLTNRNACDRYADYVCTCHAGEPGNDTECADLQLLADDPTSAVLTQCDNDLSDLKREDEDAMLVCEA
ncbi:MAG: hypothetical protein H6732_11625 [Alphaproteobacteria bacterium]|nr:hypothetical protein [Alphaproteobacteria bacterium]